jgi:hypothetical protein
VKVSPVAIALDAKDILTNLVIETSRAADEKAGSWEAPGRSNRTNRPIAITGAKPTVDANVNTSPIVDGHRQWWRITCDREIGCKCGSTGSDRDCCCCNKPPLHATLPTLQSDALCVLSLRHFDHATISGTDKQFGRARGPRKRCDYWRA